MKTVSLALAFLVVCVLLPQGNLHAKSKVTSAEVYIKEAAEADAKDRKVQGTIFVVGGIAEIVCAGLFPFIPEQGFQVLGVVTIAFGAVCAYIPSSTEKTYEKIKKIDGQEAREAASYAIILKDAKAARTGRYVTGMLAVAYTLYSLATNTGSAQLGAASAALSLFPSTPEEFIKNYKRKESASISICPAISASYAGISLTGRF